jgi:hypothetical protein
MKMLIPAASLIVIAAPFTAPLAAQTRVLDEGTFAITRNGAPVGREVFRIVRVPSANGDLYRATAQISTGDRRLAPVLMADSAGSAQSYEVGVRDGAHSVLQLKATARPSRLAVLELTPSGESVKEYVVPRRTLVLDSDIFHHYYLVPLASRGGTVAVIDPQGHAQYSAIVRLVGTEAIEIGGRATTATHYALSANGGQRDFWVDSEGRVLKVSLSDRGLIALREELPR